MAGTTVGDRLVRDWGWLDPVARFFTAIVSGFYRLPGTRWLKNVLHGTWALRHPLHPALTDVAVGGYTVLAILDVLYLWQRDDALMRPTDTVLVVALLFSLGSVVSGLTDWNGTYGNERRLGILHGLLMVLASAAFVASLWIRLGAGTDGRAGAIALSLAAFAVVIVSAHLGGEMTFGYGTGVNRLAWTSVGGKWQTLELRAEALEDRAPVAATLRSGVAVLVAKVDGRVMAITDVCTHAGCSLHEGKLVGRDRTNIQCPCHGSVFDLRTGSVLHGPATVDEFAFEARLSQDGRVEVRSREHGQG